MAGPGKGKDVDMPCISPYRLKIRQKDGTDSFIDVNCGKCAVCAARYRGEWSTRLALEQRANRYSLFVTLTYDDESLTRNDLGHPILVKRDVQLFLKRLRKSLNFPIRYYCVGEYGSITVRPHYHLLLFSAQEITDLEISKSWTFGQIKCGTVTSKSISYVTKYHVAAEESRYVSENDLASMFVLMSRRPGIGSAYLDSEDVKEWHTAAPDRDFLMLNGRRQPLPRFFRKKIYTDDTRRRAAESYLSSRLRVEFLEETRRPIAYFVENKAIKCNKSLNFSKSKKLKL